MDAVAVTPKVRNGRPTPAEAQARRDEFARLVADDMRRGGLDEAHRNVVHNARSVRLNPERALRLSYEPAFVAQVEKLVGFSSRQDRATFLAGIMRRVHVRLGSAKVGDRDHMLAAVHSAQEHIRVALEEHDRVTGDLSGRCRPQVGVEPNGSVLPDGHRPLRSS